MGKMKYCCIFRLLLETSIFFFPKIFFLLKFLSFIKPRCIVKRTNDTKNLQLAQQQHK